MNSLTLCRDIQFMKLIGIIYNILLKKKKKKYQRYIKYQNIFNFDLFVLIFLTPVSILEYFSFAISILNKSSSYIASHFTYGGLAMTKSNFVLLVACLVMISESLDLI